MSTFYMWQNGLCITYTLKFKQIEDFLIANRWNLVEDPRDADVIIIGACAAFLPYFDLYADKIKQIEPMNKRLVIYGCLPVVDKLFYRKTTPVVELFVPVRHPERIEQLIVDLDVPWSGIPEPSEFRREDYTEFVPHKRYIQIQEGCTEGCVYCPHRLAIGKERSRRREDIVQQVKRDIASGAKVLVLEGNNSGSWGLDLTPKQTYLDLLNDILGVVGYSEIYIGNFAPRWIGEYGSGLIHPQITDIKIPIQTASPRLLKLMGRSSYLREMAMILIKLKSNNEKLVLRTEVIIGFPTETDEELRETLDFVGNHFDKVSCFSYDHHPATKIAKSGLPLYTDDEIIEKLLFAQKYLSGNSHIIASFDNRGKVCEQVTRMTSAS